MVRTGRCSANERPATAWPGLMPPAFAQSGTNDIASPAEYDQRRASIDASYWSMRAPSESRRRAASSVIRWRTSAGSRMADTRAAISRNVRSASARRVVSAWERSSSSMRFEFAMATAAWSASAASRPASASSNASARSPYTVMAPTTTSRWMSGAAMTERMPASRTKASRAGVCSNRSSSR